MNLCMLNLAIIIFAILFHYNGQDPLNLVDNTQWNNQWRNQGWEKKLISYLFFCSCFFCFVAEFSVHFQNSWFVILIPEKCWSVDSLHVQTYRVFIGWKCYICLKITISASISFTFFSIMSDVTWHRCLVLHYLIATTHWWTLENQHQDREFVEMRL